MSTDQATEIRRKFPENSLIVAIYRWLRVVALDPNFWGWAAIAMGTLFRVAEYRNDRALWIDEDCLRSNVVGRPIFDFTTPMVRDQLAPPVFLAISRAWVRVAGSSVNAIRILPMLFGIASLFVMRGVAKRYVEATAVPIVLWVCASSYELIYFATEFKQYSSDFLVTLLLLIMAHDLTHREWTLRRFIPAVLIGVLAPWCSIASVFVLAGAGISLALVTLLERRWNRLAILSGVGILWLASCIGSFLVCRHLLGKSDFMWTWWDFAFLPLPPRSWVQATQVFWTFANVFIAPVGLDAARAPVATSVLAMTLFFVGSLSLFRQGRRGDLMTLLIPIALAMGASAIRRYPFHGRLLVYLIPPFALLMAQGFAVIRRRAGLIALLALIVALILPPSLKSLDQMDRARPREYDSHGDPRNDLLDYLETKERAAKFLKGKPPS